MNKNNYFEVQEEDSIDVKKIFLRFLEFWPWFVSVLLISVLTAWFLNTYMIPEFKASSTVLIKEDKKKSLAGSSFISSMDMFGSYQNIQNEIAILNSFTLNHQSVANLNLYVSYFKETKYRKEKELYKDSPFTVVVDTSKNQALGIDVNISIINDDFYEVSFNCNDLYIAMNYNTGEYANLKRDKHLCEDVFRVKFGESFDNQFFSFKIFPKQDEFNESVFEGNYKIRFNNINFITNSYRSRLTVDRISKDASILQISLVDNIPERAVDYISILTSNYIKMGLYDKNLTAIKTIEFIDKQLSGITDTLSVIEKDLEVFRSENQIIDLSQQGNAIFQKMKSVEYEKTQEEMKVGYYTYLLSYVKSDSTGKEIIAPSSIGINDPLLNSLISELVSLNSAREQLKITSSTRNPYFNELDVKINTTRKTIIENVNNILKNSKYVLSEKNKELDNVKKELSGLPKTERQLINIQRMFTVNDQIYTFLLEKRAEAAISQASNISDNKIIDSSRVESKTKPKKKQNYILAFLLGLFLPALTIIIIDFFKNTINDVADVEGLTNMPILGNSLHDKEKHSNINSISNDVVESFRSIRTNLDFFAMDKSRKIITITSINPSEGKSFCSFYLAYVFSLANKKTLFVSADIRKNDMGKVFNIREEKGLSTFLSQKCEWEDVVVKTSLENLDIVTTGPVPPNPAELLSSSNVDKVFESIQDKYDIIIFDTSPIGVFPDSAYILKRADINIFVLRYNKSKKSELKSIHQIIDKLGVKTPAIICNDMKKSKSTQYYYNYYYNSKSK